MQNIRAALLTVACIFSFCGDGLAETVQVEAQPLQAQAMRVAKALEFLGEPLSRKDAKQLSRALEQDDEDSVYQIQEVLDRRVLADVHINPESRVKVSRGNANASLVQQGWRIFLVKVHNEAGVTAALDIQSPNAGPVYKRSSGSPAPDTAIIKTSDVKTRWMSVASFDSQPLEKTLSGLECEYRIVQIFSRDAGKREATLQFNVGQGTQDLGFRSDLPILFDCQRAVNVRLNVVDDDGEPTTGQFVIKDELNRVYPSRARRLEPDFFFHDQIYRHDGESVFLPPGDYEVEYSRGPEYLILRKTINVPDRPNHSETFRLKRWIHLAQMGWYSGDHHVHAAGCAHYESPTAGVTPESMMRHILGEDLNIGCVLSWGPCWYDQKQYFDGKISPLSTDFNLMRYDVEVSGFPSSHAGHLCLLRLEEDDYPGTTKIEEWPSWDLPVLRWGKDQGGVVGFSHSGWGLQVDDDTLPSYKMPKFDGIGANEYVVDVVHGVSDFISAVDTPIIWELSVWYHTLNCGYQCRSSGETDFPCIYGERVGLGRAYVKLPKQGPLNYDQWVQGIKDGRSYCCDGRSHLIDFHVNDIAVGEPGPTGQPSLLTLPKAGTVNVGVTAAAYLDKEADVELKSRPLSEKPYWHVERARIDTTRKVPVELIVNGISVETVEIEADGALNDIQFQTELTQSSWVAVRVFPSSHTNPIFVEIDGKPIRASKRSAQWCLEAVDVCWNAKKGRIRQAEQADAKAAFDVAREAYKSIIAESYDDTK